MKVRMKIRIITICCVILFSAVLWQYQTKETKLLDLINKELAQAPSAAGKLTFNLLDAARFTDSLYPWIGFPVTVITETDLFGDSGISQPLDEITVKQQLMKYKGHKRIIFNFPGWQALVNNEMDLVLENYIDFHLQLLNWSREVLPDANLGIFALPSPPKNTLASQHNLMQVYQQFYLSLAPIFQAVDTVYPFFSAENPLQGDFFYAMSIQLYVAKTTGKPVFPIISHRAVSTDDGQAKFIAFNLLRQQCKFARKHADGMLWWTAQKEAWDQVWYDAIKDDCFQ